MNGIKATSHSEDGDETNLESEAAKVEYFCKESVKLLTNCNSNKSFINKTLRSRHSQLPIFNFLLFKILSFKRLVYENGRG
jgi:hypothetical protein